MDVEFMKLAEVCQEAILLAARLQNENDRLREMIRLMRQVHHADNAGLYEEQAVEVMR